MLKQIAYNTSKLWLLSSVKCCAMWLSPTPDTDMASILIGWKRVKDKQSLFCKIKPRIGFGSIKIIDFHRFPIQFRYDILIKNLELSHRFIDKQNNGYLVISCYLSHNWANNRSLYKTSFHRNNITCCLNEMNCKAVIVWEFSTGNKVELID